MAFSSEENDMSDTPWRIQFPQVFQRVRQIPLARNLPSSQWMFLAMESGHISSNEYLPWAQKYYGLAILNSSFFERGFNPKIYQKYKNDSPAWGPQALPLYEWDDILFVGCIDPHAVPSNLPLNCRPLLASYENLTKAWDMAFYDKPNPNYVPAPVTVAFEASPELSKPEEPIYPPPIAPPMTPPPALEENLFDFNQIENINSESAPSEEQLESEENSKESLELPDGLNFSDHQNLLTTDELKTPEDNIFGVPTSAPTEVAVDSISLKTDLPVLNKEIPKKEIRPLPFPSNPSTMELEEELKTSFAKAYQNYRNLMILKLNGDSLYPMRWDPSYKNAKSPYAISVDTPSIFRIVIRTQKPFHGPISPNDVNNQFLNHWFEGHKPKHFSIIPLFFNQACVGILLGASDEPLDRKDSLQLMESTAQMVQINFGANLAS